MSHITHSPTVTLLVASERYGRFAIAPLDDGYGVTLGNALRRVLLSSMPGAAITRIKIDRVFHEFTPIPHVREDVTELVLNIKGIRLRSYAERAVKIMLTRETASAVRAGDIDAPSTVEIVNPEHYLCTLEHDGPLSIELTVERGRGALLAHQQERPVIGEIEVDAIFSPIPKVNMVVAPLDPAGGGGLEQLVLEIWTDGTLKPGDALSYAAIILAQYHQAVVDGLQMDEMKGSEDPTAPALPAEIADTSIDVLELSTRTYNALKRSNIMTIGQLLLLNENKLGSVRNLGEKSIDEIRQQLQAHGYQSRSVEAAGDG